MNNEWIMNMEKFIRWSCFEKPTLTCSGLSNVVPICSSNDDFGDEQNEFEDEQDDKVDLVANGDNNDSINPRPVPVFEIGAKITSKTKNVIDR